MKIDKRTDKIKDFSKTLKLPYISRSIEEVLNIELYPKSFDL